MLLKDDMLAKLERCKNVLFGLVSIFCMLWSLLSLTVVIVLFWEYGKPVVSVSALVIVMLLYLVSAPYLWIKAADIYKAIKKANPKVS